MLSVALATDQISSDGCYNCTGQADSYQPAVKMVTNIPYSEVVFCIDTLHSISIYFLFLYIHPADFFPHMDSIKVCTLIKHSVTKFSVSILCHLSLHVLKKCFRKVGIFMRIIYYGIIRSGQKWSGKCM